MTLELSALPLALVAGVLSILSPCVWPLVPIVMGSAASAGRGGPLALAAGLSVSFALAGTVLSFALVSLGLDPELFRYVAATMLVVVAVPLLIPQAGYWVNTQLSRFTAGVQSADPAAASTWPAQFGVGMLLGFVWLPCVGPTLGAAIALASLGQKLVQSFFVMLAFGIGTAAALSAAGLVSARALNSVRPQLLARAGSGKVWLGAALLVLGLLVLTGLDKQLEAWAVGWLPDIATSL
ncbi:MAG: cytochrome c biogenesis CcdA family protein [Gammaproteobacteria bacterium]